MAPGGQGSTPPPTFGVVVPAHNEAGFIVRTLESLANQRGRDGRPLPEGACRIVVVENGSTDATAARVAAYGKTAPVPVALLRQERPSMVLSRIQGAEHLLERASPPEYLVSVDADTVFPPTWLAEVGAVFSQGADLVSSAGFMKDVIWRRCPRLAQRYLEEVGTVFFDPRTAARLATRDRAVLFSAEVFRDFGRPVSDAGFAVRRTCYRALGGFRQDYWDEERRSPCPAVGWPLMYRAELEGYRNVYMPSPHWTTSPRRLLQEPEELFSTTTYQGDIHSCRDEEPDRYAVLDELADRLDFRPLREYCLKYYVLQRCITRPQLLRRNARYFGPLRHQLRRRVHTWLAGNADPPPRAILELADRLCDRFGEELLARLPRTRAASSRPGRTRPAAAGAGRRVRGAVAPGSGTADGPGR